MLGAMIVALCWAASEVRPGDPRERAARAAGLLPAEGVPVSAAARAQALATVTAERGLPATAGARLAALAGGLVRGDLQSAATGEPVWSRVGRALPWTLALLAVAGALAVLAGLAAGAVAAARADGRLDAALRGLTSLALAVPLAWLAVLALRGLAWGQPWQLVPGRADGSVAGLVIPAGALAVTGAALVARVARTALVEVLARPELLAARARGLGPWRVLVGHALPLAAAPLGALVPTLVAVLLGGAAVVERACDVPGVGALLVDAASTGDTALLTALALVTGALVTAGSLVGRLVARRAVPGDAR